MGPLRLLGKELLSQESGEAVCAVLVLTVIMSSCTPICTVLSVCAIRSSKKRRERKQNRDETEDVTALLQNYTAQQRRLQLLITPTDDRETDLKLPEIVPTAFLRYDSQS